MHWVRLHWTSGEEGSERLTSSAKMWVFLAISEGFQSHSAFWPKVTEWLSCFFNEKLVLLLKELLLFALISAPVGVWEGDLSGKKSNNPFLLLACTHQHSTTPIYSSGKGCHSIEQLFRDHLAGGEDGISARNVADRHLGRGRHELQRETLLPSYSPLKLIPSMKWIEHLIRRILKPK